ncbi:BatA domain-containing protein [Salegentibacter sp. F14]
MHFKQPEVLFALVFLLIPLLVHLFQLRKYQKEDFTNVKFLKRISRETRKSSRIKKWLVLFTRLMALGSIIIAFALPYLPAQQQQRANSEKLIYLDNSLSMQASGKSGELLNTAIQDLLKNIPQEGRFHLISNDQEFKDLDARTLKDRLTQVEFSANSLDFQDIELRASQIAPAHSPIEIIMLSDFKHPMDFPGNYDGKAKVHPVPLRPVKQINFSLDSLYTEERDPEVLELHFIVGSNQENSDPITISVFNAEELLARKTLSFNKNRQLEGSFQLNTEKYPAGRLEIEDNALQYDNRLFFSINPPEKIKGAVISKDLSRADFLNRIFTEEEFEFHNFTPQSIDYNLLSSSSFVILNELEELPSSLRVSLERMHKENKTIVIIPSGENSALNSFLESMEVPGFGNLISQEMLVTDIVFEHPLLKSVFEEEVRNFDYPKVNQYYGLVGKNQVLAFQNKAAFLSQQENIYLFAAPLNKENSNFKNAPLVVPVFYNLGLTARSLPQLYYQVNSFNQIEVPIESIGDQVVSMVSENENFIPAQQAFAGKVRLSTENLPRMAGNFSLNYMGKKVGNISYNYSREESSGQYQQDFNNIETVYSSVSEYFNHLQGATQSKALWKWFVILALIFLTAEMLLLKYLK